ncbi:peptide ABC transporter substrate-binding protein [Larsenimonas rhizosphaerae]|uniref:Peptide ABC transporter substrate-binding protein n=1 Tax=Larsenimonas rhizosphaerae TaxID=2944682 RepID=A0AA41ZHX3_9GAMM|nr:peptide ABC transporter substrate-binding protein [Larsenimonas rhizosphaerae]MCX2525016.1 peptide ABC transporter substrate-binding protein [Larsenimonas rhizosphaerae]
MTLRRCRVLALLLSLAAGSGQAATLHVDNEGEPGSLDPQKSNNQWDARIQKALFDRLVDVAADGTLIPGLARSWDVSADGTVWTFHLRDARWSDGTPITAEDAVFSLRRLLTPATANRNANLYYAIHNARAVNLGKTPPESLGVDAVDESTLRVTLDHPSGYFLEAMAMAEAAPLPAHVITRGERWITPGNTVVSGAFTLGDWIPQSRLTLDRNPAFYAADTVALDKVVMYPLEDTNDAIRRFRSGRIDLSLAQVPSSRIDWLRTNMPEALQQGPWAGEYFYMFNVRKGPLADARVREALNLVVRRDIITDKILGTGMIPSTRFVPGAVSGQGDATMPGLDAPWPERLSKAKALMKDAGYSPAHPLRLTLRYNTNDDHRKVAVAVAAMWKPLGVETTLYNSEAAVHYAAIHAGQFDVARYGMIATINDPFDFLGSMAQGGSAAESSGYTNAAFTEAVRESETLASPEARFDALTRAEQQLLDDHAVLPIYEYVASHLVSPRVHGFESNVMDEHPLRFLSITPPTPGE